jgi:hypothetical protein
MRLAARVCLFLFDHHHQQWSKAMNDATNFLHLAQQRFPDAAYVQGYGRYAVEHTITMQAVTLHATRDQAAQAAQGGAIVDLTAEPLSGACRINTTPDDPA